MSIRTFFDKHFPAYHKAGAAISYIITPFVKYKRKVISTYFPKRQLINNFKSSFGYKPDVKHPRDLNEYIIHEYFYHDTSTWTPLSDKYVVREYIKEKGYESALPTLLGVWDSADDIPFDSLTPPYVLKTNHGSGSNIFIFDKNNDLDSIKKELNKSLRNKFGLFSGESHYFKIQPKVIAEKLHDISKQDFPSTSTIDYKIWCFNGEPYLYFIIYDRHNTNKNPDKTKVELKDLDWNDKKEWFQEDEEFTYGDGRAIEPKCKDQLLTMARDLAQGFKQVRVDLYVIDNKPYFGELTFSSFGGVMNYFTPEALTHFRNLIKE